MKAIKFYQVKPTDINDYGELDPNAELIPQFASLYRYRPGTRKETYSSEDAYDNNTNMHPGRHFNIYDEKGKLIKENSHVEKRGYSAIGYLRDRNKWDNLFGGWLDFDPKVSQDQFDKHARDYYSNHTNLNPENKYELHRVNHYIIDDDGWGSDPIAEQESLAEALHDGNLRYGKRYLKIPGEHTPLKTISLPFIVEGNDDDIVSFDDIMNKNYDPGRDYAKEVQLKNIRVKRLPSGLLSVESSEDTSDTDVNIADAGLRFCTFIKNYIQISFHFLDNIDKNALDVGDFKTAYATFDVSYRDYNAYELVNSFLEKLSKFFYTIKSYSDSPYKYADELVAYLGDELVGCMHSNGLTGDDYFRYFLDKNPCKDYKDIEASYNIMVNYILVYISDIDLDGLRDYCNRLKSARSYKNKSGNIIRVNSVNWMSFLDDNFSPNDNTAISDRHMKHIIKDASDYIKHRRTISDIVNCVSRRY